MKNSNNDWLVTVEMNMKLLNRSSFTLLAKAPFAQWIASLEGKKSCEEGYELLSLAQLRESGSLYLIDEVVHEDDFERLIQDSWRKMFENELTAWDEFEDYWPALSYSRFTQWFDVQTNLMTFDVSLDPIMSATISD